MSPRIRILTDSTADVPPELARQLNITVVPAYVQIEGQSLRDGEQITREEFYRRLPSLSKVPTTAVPSVYEFAAAFRSLVGQADEVIAILLAGALSSMISVAELGAREVPELKVHFVDSQQLAMGIGWQVIMAAEAAARGGQCGGDHRHAGRRPAPHPSPGGPGYGEVSGAQRTGLLGEGVRRAPAGHQAVD